MRIDNPCSIPIISVIKFFSQKLVFLNNVFPQTSSGVSSPICYCELKDLVNIKLTAVTEVLKTQLIFFLILFLRKGNMKLEDTYDVKYTVECPIPFLWPYHTKNSVNSETEKGVILSSFLLKAIIKTS